MKLQCPITRHLAARPVGPPHLQAVVVVGGGFLTGAHPCLALSPFFALFGFAHEQVELVDH